MSGGSHAVLFRCFREKGGSVIGDLKRRVMDYIEEEFDLSNWDLLDWPLLPGGTLLTCKEGGSILIWADLVSDSIYYSINGEPAVVVKCGTGRGHMDK